MSSSIICVYKKQTLTEQKRNQLINYAKDNHFGLHFEHSNNLVQEIVDSIKDDQNYFIISDDQLHDTVDEILTWNWLLPKDKLLDHHAFLDKIKDILMSKNNEYAFDLYVSFDSYASLSEYENVVNISNISKYYSDYISTKYLMPGPKKFTY